MPQGFVTITVSAELQKKLRTIANETATREGLSKVSVSQLLERMIKVYEEKQAV